MKTEAQKLWKKVGKMDLGNPMITALVGLSLIHISEPTRPY